MAAHFI